MNIKKNPEKLLDISINVLEKSYKMAKKKDDLETMLAIADRLMLLYSMLDDGSNEKGKAFGFRIDGGEDDE